MPGDGRGRGEPGLTPSTTATNGPMSLPDRGDPQAIGELLACWIGCKVEEVDSLVEQARSRLEAIPNIRTLWLIHGEVLVRLAAVEHELAELRKVARR